MNTIRPGNENFWTLVTVSDLALAYQESGFVPEVIEPYATISKPAGAVAPTQQEVIRFYANWAEYILNDVRILMTSYLTERPPYHPRHTPEEKAKRAYKVLTLLDKSLISRINQEALWVVYNNITEGPDKQVRFVEAVRYLVVSVIFYRMNDIFTDKEDSNSPSLSYLKSEIDRIIETITDIWNQNGLQDGIKFLDRILETRLKGASRRRY